MRSRVLAASLALAALLPIAGPGAAQNGGASLVRAQASQALTSQDFRSAARGTELEDLINLLLEVDRQWYEAREGQALTEFNAGVPTLGSRLGEDLGYRLITYLAAAPAADLRAFNQAKADFIDGLARDNPAACGKLSSANVLGLFGPSGITSRDRALADRYREARRHAVLTAAANPVRRSEKDGRLFAAIEARLKLRGLSYDDVTRLASAPAAGTRTPAQRCAIAVGFAHALAEIDPEIGAQMYLVSPPGGRPT